MDKQSLLVSTPCKTGFVSINYTVSLLQNLQGLANRNVTVTFDLEVGKAGIDMPRSMAATRFLKSDMTHLMFIDDDMAFPPDLITKLMDCDVDIVAVPYRKKMNDPLYNFRFFGEVVQSKENPALIEVYDIATGLMLVKHHVFEKLKDHVEWVLEYGQDDKVGMFFRHQVVEYEHAEGAGEKGGKAYMSEDLHFCRLAREAGFKIWAYVDAPTIHYGTMGFGGNYADVLEQVMPNEKFRGK